MSCLWFRGIEPGRFEAGATVIGSGGGSLPVVHNVDDDGDLDVGSAEYFSPGASYVWFENTTADAAEPGPFVRHVMTDEMGRAIELAVVPDLFGDGDPDLALSGDGDDRVFWLEQTESGRFETHALATGFGQAAGGADVDLDGDDRAEIVFTSYETQQLVIFTAADVGSS